MVEEVLDLLPPAGHEDVDDGGGVVL